MPRAPRRRPRPVPGATALLAVGLALSVSAAPPAARSAPPPLRLPALAPPRAPARTAHFPPPGRARAQSAPAPAPAPAWQPIGPSPLTGFGPGPVSGRVTAVVPAPDGVLYVGSAGGGVWASRDGGATWTPLTDGQPDLAIGALAVDPTDPQVVYAGTGEDDQAVDSFYGDGLLKSSDGGRTWTLLGQDVFGGGHFSALVVDPADPAVVYAAGDFGLWRSQDGGATWSDLPVATAGGGAPNVTSLLLDPADPQTLYAGVEGVGVERSQDGGATWQLLSGALPSGQGVGRIALALAPPSPSGPGALYAAVASDAQATSGDLLGLYESVDGGDSWSQLNVPDYMGYAYAYGSGSSGQGYYDNVLAVDPLDPRAVYAGGIALLASADGGLSWTDVGQADGIHVDVHALAFDAQGDLYVGTDGGVWEIPAQGAVRDLNPGLDITQFYPGLAGVGPGPGLLAGSQDNGTDVYTGSPAWSAAPDACGDGAANAVDPLDGGVWFAACAGGGLQVTTDGGQSWRTITPPTAHPAPWLSPLAVAPAPQSPADPVLYVGEANVWRTTDDGATWTRLTDFTDAASGAVVSALAVAPSDPAVVYAGLGDGALYMSEDAGATWSQVPVPDGSGGAGGGRWITHVAVSPQDPYRVGVTFSGHAFPQSSPSGPHVLVTQDASASQPVWQDVTGNLPPSPTNALLMLGAGGDTLVVAADAGVFVSTRPGVWLPLGSGLPAAQVVDVGVVGADLVALTHGRGAWELPLASLTQVDVALSADTAAAGTAVTVTVSALDAAGNPLAGLPLELAVTGTLSPAGLSARTVTTDAQGQAQATYTDTRAGDAGTVEATGPAGVGAGQSPHLTVTPAAPAAVRPVGAASTAAAGRAVTLAFLVTDAYGNPVPGVPVTFSVTGTLKAADLRAAAAATDASGLARVTYADPTPGDRGSVVATLPGGESAQAPLTVAALPPAVLALTMNGRPLRLLLSPSPPLGRPLTVHLRAEVGGYLLALPPLRVLVAAPGRAQVVDPAPGRARRAAAEPAALLLPLVAPPPAGPPQAIALDLERGRRPAAVWALPPTAYGGRAVRVAAPFLPRPARGTVLVAVLAWPGGRLVTTVPRPR